MLYQNLVGPAQSPIAPTRHQSVIFRPHATVRHFVSARLGIGGGTEVSLIAPSPCYRTKRHSSSMVLFWTAWS